MTITRGFKLPPFAPFLSLLLASGFLVSCSTSTPTSAGGEVLKFKSYHLTADAGVRSQDPAIPFERKHLMHGAVTSEEKRERYGNYMDFFWKVTDRNQPATLLFEYFQTRTGSELKKSQPIEVSKPKSYNATSFRIIGDEYEASGPVMAWKFTITQGGQEVAKQESYLWSETLKRRSQEDAADSTTTVGGSGSPKGIPSSDLKKLYDKGAEKLLKQSE